MKHARQIVTTLLCGCAAACGDARGAADAPQAPRAASAPAPAQGVAVDDALALALEAAREEAARPGAGANAARHLGDLCLAHGLYAQAQRAYSEAVARDPDHTDGWYGLALVELERADPDAALDALEETCQRDPRRRAPLWRRGLLHLERGELEAAAALFETLAEIDPDEPSAALGMARVAFAAEEFTAALEALRPLFAVSPRDGRGHALAARAHRALGQVDAAEEALARAGEHTSAFHDPREAELRALRVGVRARLERAEALAQHGDARGALDELAPLASDDPYNLAALTLATACRVALAEYDQALAALQAARRAGVDHPRIDANLGFVHLRRGDPQQALFHLLAAQAQNPDWQPLEALLEEARLALAQS